MGVYSLNQFATFLWLNLRGIHATSEEIREGKKVCNIELLYQSGAEIEMAHVTVEIPPMPPFPYC
jgi:hypothetical protein